MESKHKGILKKADSKADVGDHIGIKWDEKLVYLVMYKHV